MLIFDEEEKQIIKKIIYGKGYARNLLNLLDSRNNLQNTRIEIDKENRKASFLFQIQKREPTDIECGFGIEKQTQLTELIIKYVTLLRYLEKEELAIFFDPVKSDEAIIKFGMGAVNMNSFCMSLDDQNVVDLLINYIHKEIMPSPSLKALEKNKYISDEERRFNRQQKAAWAAIVGAFLIGFCGIYYNHQNCKDQEIQRNLQIQENRRIADSIIKKIDITQASNIDYRPVIKEVSRELAKTRNSRTAAPNAENSR